MACGAPSPSSTGCSRNFARPSPSVKSTVLRKVAGMCRYSVTRMIGGHHKGWSVTCCMHWSIPENFIEELPDELAEESSSNCTSDCSRRDRPLWLRQERERPERDARSVVHRILVRHQPVLAVGLHVGRRVPAFHPGLELVQLRDAAELRQQRLERFVRRQLV